MVTGLLVFDGDCGFCTTSVRWLERQFPGSFDTTPYQYADLPALGLTAEQCHERLQWIGPREHRQGHRAVAAVLRVGGIRRGGAIGAAARGLAVLAEVPPSSWVAAGLYAWVAANRYRLPGGTPACAMG